MLNILFSYSFRDESDNSWSGDILLLMAGVCIIVVYVAVILGKFNEVEHKVVNNSQNLVIVEITMEKKIFNLFLNLRKDLKTFSAQTTLKLYVSR